MVIFDLRNQAKPWMVLKEIRVREKKCKSPSLGFELAIAGMEGTRSANVATESLDKTWAKIASIFLVQSIVFQNHLWFRLVIQIKIHACFHNEEV